MKFLKELNDDYSVDEVPLMEAISTAVKELKLMKNGKVMNNRAVKAFIKNNASLVNSSALKALSSYKQYKTNARNLISFHSTDAYSKKMMTKMVKTLTDSKMFKLHRTRYSGNNKYWEHKKIKSGF